jgi:hypothetical protein
MPVLTGLSCAGSFLTLSGLFRNAARSHLSSLRLELRCYVEEPAAARRILCQIGASNETALTSPSFLRMKADASLPMERARSRSASRRTSSIKMKVQDRVA